MAGVFSDRINILGVGVSELNLGLAFQKIGEWIKERRRVYVCVAPVSTICDCQRDRAYKEIINSAAMVTADGMPLVWISRLKGYKNKKRTYGPELMSLVCDKGQVLGYRHFFYGADEKTLCSLREKLKQRFPGIDIVGMYGPPFLKKAEPEKKEIIDMINSARPDILWVGIGSPKQDFWMSLNRERLNAPVMVGIGAAFDFLAEVKLQAPAWMRECGLEWLFRLVTEPKRLWRRYLVNNTLFVYYIVLEFFLGIFPFKRRRLW
ncbi:MAG: WecB/TagA/CpsF family glycosyltransferase [Candidatus Omnitrophota bacterium]|nr:WecB/TagA/CpsF family glycosyltransferase [Candidatus Omnitrophota bacterium]